MIYTIETLQQQYERSCQYILQAQYDPRDTKQVLAIGLYIRAVESVGAILTLLPTEFHSAIFTLARTTLEACAQLGYLSKNPEQHTKVLMLMDLEESLRRIEDNPQFTQERGALQTQIDSYKNEGLKRVNLRKMLEIWGYPEVYDNYRFLSQHSHVSVSSIAEISVGVETLRLGGRMSAEIAQGILALLCELLGETIVCINKCLYEIE